MKWGELLTFWESSIQHAPRLSTGKETGHCLWVVDFGINHTWSTVRILMNLSASGALTSVLSPPLARALPDQNRLARQAGLQEQHRKHRIDASPACTPILMQLCAYECSGEKWEAGKWVGLCIQAMPIRHRAANLRTNA